MNYAETEYWVSSLFPGDLRVEEITVVAPARGRHGQDMVGPPVTLGGVTMPADGVAATGAVRELEAWCTLDLGRWDTRLRTPDGADVRVELFSVGYADEPISDCVAAAATMLMEDTSGELSPKPGSLLPDVVELATGDLTEDPGCTVAHGLLTVPALWPGKGTPQVTETAQTIHRHDDEEPTDADGRVTALVQLIIVTDAEAAYALEHGIGSLLELFREHGADVRDLHRPSVA